MCYDDALYKFTFYLLSLTYLFTYLRFDRRSTGIPLLIIKVTCTVTLPASRSHGDLFSRPQCSSPEQVYGRNVERS